MKVHHKLLSGSSINGTIVENKNGDNIGSIEDVMIDTRTGKIAYAVLAVDSGFLNLGSKFFAVPMQALEFDLENKRILMDITSERLKSAPGFDKENWPKGPESDFIGSVYDFYEVEREERYSAEMPYNRNSLSGNAATRQASGGFKSEGSDLHDESTYDHGITGNYNKSIH